VLRMAELSARYRAKWAAAVAPVVLAFDGADVSVRAAAWVPEAELMARAAAGAVARALVAAAWAPAVPRPAEVVLAG
jgi:hypothetical protein